ncbi:MAG: bifunctional riboflavin kinase/FAD synthetase [Bradymonadia bacterium]
MSTFRHYQKIEKLGATVAAIGNFDGVHRGHQGLLNLARERSEHHGCVMAALTFYPHPSEVVGRRAPVPALYTLSDRLALLQHYGVQAILAQEFDLEFAGLSPNAFVRDVLVDALQVRAVVVGYNFGFGAKREGRVERLSRLGDELGFEVHVVKPIRDELEGDISSTRIRDAVVDGRLDEAAACLGRNHSVTGRVERGEQRGRLIGFPTLNLAPDVPTLPPNGVYAGWLDSGEHLMPAVANLGYTPTFGSERPRRLEVHVLNAVLPTIYGHSVRFYFHRKLRAEQKFSGPDALKEQIALDCQAARDSLAEQSAPPRFSLGI